MNYTVIAIKWFTSADFSMNRTLQPPTVVDVANKDLRTTITSLLFDQGYNQCLLRWKGSLFVCDKFDTSIREYSKTIVKYHPYMNYLN
jgi:hypothetical protein